MSTKEPIDDLLETVELSSWLTISPLLIAFPPDKSDGTVIHPTVEEYIIDAHRKNVFPVLPEKFWCDHVGPELKVVVCEAHRSLAHGH